MKPFTDETVTVELELPPCGIVSDVGAKVSVKSAFESTVSAKV